jgi:Family of unknown function (DUF5681)
LNSPADGDYRVGYGRPPQETRWKKGKSGNPRHRRPKPTQSTVQVIDRLLFNQVPVVMNGESKKVTALEAIVVQLQQKAIAGNAQAHRVLLKYQDFACINSVKKLELTFVDNEYTRALANKARNDDQ